MCVWCVWGRERERDLLFDEGGGRCFPPSFFPVLRGGGGIAFSLLSSLETAEALLLNELVSCFTGVSGRFLMRPVRSVAPLSVAGPSRVSFACVEPHRGFYAGLDEGRVHRLRRSSITFNKPRGRDALSLAFESRLRVLPLRTVSDLYGPVEPPQHRTRPLRRDASLPGPRAGDGSRDKAAERMDPESSKEWRVLVAQPLAPWEVEWPVPLPSFHPFLYPDGAGDPQLKDLFDELPWEGQQSPTALDSRAEAPGPASPSQKETRRFFASSNRRQLRQNGDTTLFPAYLKKCFERHPQQQRVQFFLSLMVDPLIDLERFRREEAQVEMLSGYRNLFYEAVELPAEEPSATGPAGLHRVRRTSTRGRVADVVRVPALSVYSCGPRFFHEIGKLNQQSIIKGFHRVSNEAKEQLLLNTDFTVELYVPPPLLKRFERAFKEEAWETPQSTLNPGRTALYPGLAPPRSLLAYDGWIGKRPELIEAIETEGKSLMKGRKLGLDGREIQEQEVFSSIRVYGSREEEAQMLAREQQTAQEQLGGEAGKASRRKTVPELQPGLLQDYEPMPDCGRSPGADADV